MSTKTQIALTAAQVIAAGFATTVANLSLFSTHGDKARAMLESMAVDIKATGTFVYTSRCDRYYDSQKVGKVVNRTGKVYDAGSRSIRAAITEEIAFDSPSAIAAAGLGNGEDGKPLTVQHVQKGVGVFQKVINAVLADDKSSADLRMVAKFCKDNLKRKAATEKPAEVATTEAAPESESQKAVEAAVDATETQATKSSGKKPTKA
jgi:hypothetical protein